MSRLAFVGKTVDLPTLALTCMPLEKPHDKFFKETFSRFDILTDFIQVFLPPQIVQKLHFNSLARKSDSYLDAQLSEYFVDLLFSIDYGSRPIQIALLLEHKSYVEDFPHFQLNQYLLNYWTTQIKAKLPLIPVIPIVVYHGERQWPKQSVISYFTELADELTPFVPSFDYILIDLSIINNQRLSAFTTDYARLTALLLQNSRHQQRLLRLFEQFSETFDRLSQDPVGRTFIETTFIYIYWTTNLTKDQVVTIFHKISIQTGAVAMTTAERLINEGIEKGLEQGVEFATLRAVKSMLKLNMDAKTIAAALDVPLTSVTTLIQKIKSGLA